MLLENKTVNSFNTGHPVLGNALFISNIVKRKKRSLALPNLAYLRIYKNIYNNTIDHHSSGYEPVLINVMCYTIYHMK